MNIFMKNEYDTLLYCLAASPYHLQITGNSNPFAAKIDKELACTQHQRLITILRESDVTVEFLNKNESPSQVFTKDIGFVIEDILFISNMAQSIRQAEIKELMASIEDKDIKIHRMAGTIEGGDVLLHNDKIFIGQGGRTTARAVEEIREVLQRNHIDYELIRVLFDTSKIHLDCVFNILDRDTCILSDEVYNPDVITSVFSNIIKASKEDTDNLAPNIINLGNRQVLCSNENLKNLLLSHGYHPKFIDYSEIIKASGSIGCCFLPMLRKNNDRI